LNKNIIIYTSVNTGAIAPAPVCIYAWYYINRW